MPKVLTNILNCDIALALKQKKVRVENQIDDLSYHVILQHGELIEPIIYSTEQYRKPHSPFLMKVLQEGKEVYRA